MTSRLLCAVSLAALACACSGGASSIAQADFAAKFAATECTKALACCSAYSGAPTEAACEQAISAELSGTFGMTGTNVIYDGSAAGNCVSDLNGFSCDEIAYAALPQACSQIFHGTLANGATCSAGTQCQSALCINLTSDSSGTLSGGVCAPGAAAGAVCTSSAANTASSGQVCAQGSFQSYDTNDNCTCKAAGATGAACQSDGSECASGYCGTGDVCAAIPSTPLTSQECTQFYGSISGSM